MRRSDTPAGAAPCGAGLRPRLAAHPVKDFLYVFKPGRDGPDAPPLHPAMRSLPLRSVSVPGGWRVTRVVG